jgi:hypothetical protein
MGRTAQVSETRWTCGEDGHCILTGRWLHHFTAYVMVRRLPLAYQAVSLSDRSCRPWRAGRRQSRAVSQSRRTVYTTIRQGAPPKSKLRFLGSPRFPSGQSRDSGGLITVPGTSRSIETGFVKIGQRTAERIENTHTNTQTGNKYIIDFCSRSAICLSTLPPYYSKLGHFGSTVFDCGVPKLSGTIASEVSKFMQIIRLLTNRFYLNTKSFHIKLWSADNIYTFVDYLSLQIIHLFCISTDSTMQPTKCSSRIRDECGICLDFKHKTLENM